VLYAKTRKTVLYVNIQIHTVLDLPGRRRYLDRWHRRRWRRRYASVGLYWHRRRRWVRRHALAHPRSWFHDVCNWLCDCFVRERVHRSRLPKCRCQLDHLDPRPLRRPTAPQTSSGHGRCDLRRPMLMDWQRRVRHFRPRMTSREVRARTTNNASSASTVSIPKTL
jgi:hypothetical protein